MALSKPGGGNVTEPGVEPTSSGCMTEDRTTDLKRSAVISGTGIHRLTYRDICVAATAHNRPLCVYVTFASKWQEAAARLGRGPVHRVGRLLRGGTVGRFLRGWSCT